MKREARRSFPERLRGVGWPVGMATASGGDELRSEESQGRGEATGEGERGQGGAWRSGEASRASGKESGKQEVARRMPACGGHTPLSFW